MAKETLRERVDRKAYGAVATAAELIAEAPKHLQYRAMLYQKCLTRCAAPRQKLFSDTGEVRAVQPDEVKAVLRALTKLSVRADPEASDLVIFDIHYGGDIQIACIGFHLGLIVVAGGGTYAIVQTPRWVHTMMVEAIEWERRSCESDLNPQTEDELHPQVRFGIGDSHPAPEESILVAAMVLWAPLSGGVYQDFFDALEAAKLLG